MNLQAGLTDLGAEELLKSPKVIVTVVVVAATGWALGKVMYPPAHVRNQHLRDQIAVERQRGGLIGELHQAQAERDRLSKNLSPGSPDWLIKTTLANAAAAGLVVSDLSPQPTQTIPAFGLKRDAVRLTGTAPTYHQLGRFVSLCEQQQELIRVDAVQVTGGAEAGGTNLQVVLTLTTFYPAEAL